MKTPESLEDGDAVRNSTGRSTGVEEHESTARNA